MLDKLKMEEYLKEALPILKNKVMTNKQKKKAIEKWKLENKIR
jgi:hypothetical protein